MTADIWIALATANFLACLAPGQNAALIGAITARGGPVRASFAMLGILLAELIWACIAIYLTFGARELAGDSFVLIQIASAGVLIWFGICAIRDSVERSATPTEHGPFALTCQGCFVGLANPLALVFFLSVFPAFVPAGTSGPHAVTFFVSAILISSALGLLPYIAAGGLVRRAGKSHLLQLISGSALMGTGGLLLVKIAV